MLIWDLDTNPPLQDSNIILWNQFDNYVDRNFISIPDFIELHTNELRSIYLSYVHDFGDTKIFNKDIKSHFEIRSGLSFWWMTNIFETSNDKSLNINNSIRVLALEKIIAEKSVNHLFIKSRDYDLIQAVVNLSNLKSLKLTILGVPRYLLRFRRYYLNLISFIKIFISLLIFIKLFFKLFIRRRVHAPFNNNSNRVVTIFSYLSNINNDYFYGKSNFSYYWANLPNLIYSKGLNIIWVHIYTKNKFISSYSAALKTIRRLNSIDSNRNYHFLLESFLNFKIFKDTLNDWTKIITRYFKVTNGLRNISLYKTSLFPLFERDWINSFLGSDAINNLLYINLFKKAINRCQGSNLCFYLQENQAWEVAFLYYWKLQIKSNVIGVQHSTVRFWDLRYHKNYLLLSKYIRLNCPLPNFTAVNSEISMNSFISAGYSKDQIVPVESLRYSNLKISYTSKKKSYLSNRLLRVLIYGDYLESDTNYLLLFIKKVVTKLESNWVLYIKPHPASLKFNINAFDIDLNLVDTHVDFIYDNYDIVLTGNTTSSSVDAYLQAVPVITILNPSTLNFSPLLNFDNVYFVKNQDEFVQIFYKIVEDKLFTFSPKKIFYYNNDYILWNDLINNTLNIN